MIKYHDNINGEQYGSDHTLTNNWNPDCDYGNEYVNVYFRIDTPTYHYNNGFVSAEERDKWKTEVSSLISSFGILEDSGWLVEHSKDKRAYLHAHPQEISGVVLKNDVRKIAEAICNMNLSSIRWVDLYNTVYAMTDEEYERYLDGKKEEIRKALFETSSTTRTTRYYHAYIVANRIANRIRLYRLGLDNRQTINYILKVADKMIEDGYLKCFEDGNGKYIRSLNKTEQKKMKLCM